VKQGHSETSWIGLQPLEAANAILALRFDLLTVLLRANE
jgi:hypothetical protein